VQGGVEAALAGVMRLASEGRVLHVAARSRGGGGDQYSAYWVAFVADFDYRNTGLAESRTGGCAL
jgi:hypothetical protein